jgi:hypothetical protein
MRGGGTWRGLIGATKTVKSVLNAKYIDVYYYRKDKTFISVLSSTILSSRFFIFPPTSSTPVQIQNSKTRKLPFKTPLI